MAVERVNRRVLRRVLSITLSLAVMGLLAYAFGQLTRTEWVWWLAPLTVSLDASLLFRVRRGGSGALLSPSELSTFRDGGVPIYLVASGVAAAIVAWGAYTGNRLTIIVAAALAILGRALEGEEEQPAERRNDR